jgi:hypothetical protein
MIRSFPYGLGRFTAIPCTSKRALKSSFPEPIKARAGKFP